MSFTGKTRKVKDAAADLHGLLQKWIKYNTEGMNIVNEIASIKLQNVEQTKTEENDDVENPIGDKIPVELENLCTKLAELIHKMENIVLKMEAMIMMFKGLHELEIHQQEKEKKYNHHVILFQTWTLIEFENTTSELYSMYKTELKLKWAILENICHTEHRSIIMFYIAAWIHQPYIEDRSKLLLDSMLIETGHK